MRNALAEAATYFRRRVLADFPLGNYTLCCSGFTSFSLAECVMLRRNGYLLAGTFVVAVSLCAFNCVAGNTGDEASLW